MNSRIVHIGVGASREVDSLEIDWPSGIRHSFAHIPADQRIEVVEGEGAWRTLVRLKRFALETAPPDPQDGR
jgi:hypothetical protein